MEKEENPNLNNKKTEQGSQDDSSLAEEKVESENKEIKTEQTKEITPEILQENGLVSKNDFVKVLGRGEIKSTINVTAHKFSNTAKAAIEGKGGNCTEL